MSQVKDAADQAAEQLKKDRSEMAKNNQKHMEDLAKIQPEPTIEEIHKATGYVAPKKTELKPAASTAAEKTTDEKDLEAKQQKALESKPAAGYITRDAVPKK